LDSMMVLLTIPANKVFDIKGVKSAIETDSKLSFAGMFLDV